MTAGTANTIHPIWSLESLLYINGISIAARKGRKIAKLTVNKIKPPYLCRSKRKKSINVVQKVESRSHVQFL